MVEADAGPIGLKPQAIQGRIMRAKQNILSPADLVAAHAADPAIHSVGAVYRAYQQLMDSQRLLDYEDLILQTVRRLETDAAFQTACRARFRHVFVDEYQDVNNGQYRIIRALVPPEAPERNLCVIGDPDQSIYGFRGSDPAYFRNFGADYPDAGRSVLSRNYRSTDSILSASFQVIRRDGAERARTYSGIEGVKTISMLELSNEHHEAEAITRIIDGLVGGTGFHALDTGRVRDANLSHALSYTDFAVLARTHAQLRLMADVFGKAGIPFQMVSRKDTLKQAGMVELVSLLKIVAGVGGYADVDRAAPIVVPAVNRKIIATFKAWCFKNRLPLKDGLAAAVRFPVPGLSRTQQLKLTEFASSVFSLADETAPMDARGKLAYLSRQPGLAPFFETEDSTAALDRLAGMSAASGTDTVGFLAAIALHTDTDAFHPRAEKVALMSMHAAKGLEFSVVFIVGCEDGLIPYRRAADECSDVEEERRLFYVAMTRARQRLYLSCAKRRRVFGKAEARAVSPFVRDIEERLRKDETPRPGRKKKKDDQLQLF
jgi:superfamily I DNA/RNA helicase